MTSGIRAERLFAELCNEHFLKGFVFHNPRFIDTSEKEAGDVVLWVRRQVVVFEVISRDVTAGDGTKSFVKRIGKKRDQLLSDFVAFSDKRIDIQLTNEYGEKVLFDKPDIGDFGFAGIVIVDCDSHLEHLDFGTLKKSLTMPFPVAIMTLQDFLALTVEVDTVPDLMFYLLDRYAFLKCVFESHPKHFLNLNCQLETNLIAYYKTNDNVRC